MKCEKLIKYKADENFGNGLVYSILEVDQVLDEMDAEIASLKAENKQLKAKLDDTIAAVTFDLQVAVTRERRLRRALYKTCANWAMNARMVEIETEPWGENHESRLWAGVYDKCLKKAEEYK